MNRMTAKKQPRRERRKRTRSVSRGDKLLVEISKGTMIAAIATDESPSGGASILFQTEPSLTVGTIITVWFRRTPTNAEVRYVLKQSDYYRVGVRWFDTGERRKARPYGSIGEKVQDGD